MPASNKKAQTERRKAINGIHFCFWHLSDMYMRNTLLNADHASEELGSFQLLVSVARRFTIAGKPTYIRRSRGYM